MAHVKYNGNGDEHLYGIPARDLSEDEFEALPDDQKKSVREAILSDRTGPLYNIRGEARDQRKRTRERVEDMAPLDEPTADPDPLALVSADEQAAPTNGGNA